MREIKFRAWLTQDKVFVHNIRINNKDQRVAACAYEDEVIYQQYTGLKDKNGVEIYEGDILNNENVVTWNRHTAAWCVVSIDSYPGLFLEKFSDHLFGAEREEVTGNIYENEDLLR